MAKLTKKEKQVIFEKEEAQRKANSLLKKKTTTRAEDLKLISGEKITPEIKTEPEPKKTILEQHENFRDNLNPETTEQKPLENLQPDPEPLKQDLEKRTLSLWDEIKTPTNEDSGIKDQVKEVAGTLQNLASEANESFNNISEIEAEQLAQKTSYKVKASIVVELCDVAFMVLCLLLTWNFDDDNQKKFTLNTERKKAIVFNLQKVYELEGKKLTPKKDIMFLIIGSYVPMLLVAVFMLINRLKTKAEDKKNKTAFSIQQMHQQKETDNLKNQLASLQYEKEILQREVESKNPMTIKPDPKPKEFLNVPDLGRIKKTALKTASTGSGRGVKAGMKRGSYKKLNK